MKITLAFGLALIASCVAPRGPTASEDSETRQAAADALTAFVDAWNQAATGDPQAPTAYGMLYWPDAELVDPSGRIWHDQPAIVQMHVDLWNTGFKASVVKGTVRRTRRLSPTLMIADFDLELALFGQAPSGGSVTNGVVRTHLKHVMEKRSGTWKVVAAQNTFYSGSLPAR